MGITDKLTKAIMSNNITKREAPVKIVAPKIVPVKEKVGPAKGSVGELNELSSKLVQSFVDHKDHKAKEAARIDESLSVKVTKVVKSVKEEIEAGNENRQYSTNKLAESMIKKKLVSANENSEIRSKFYSLKKKIDESTDLNTLIHGSGKNTVLNVTSALGSFTVAMENNAIVSKSSSGVLKNGKLHDMLEAYVAGAGLNDLLTKTTHPNIFEAFKKIDLDGGNPSSEKYDVPDYWIAKLPKIEAALAKLSPKDLETFCCGTPEEIDAISKKSNDLKIANKFLAEYTSGW